MFVIIMDSECRYSVKLLLSLLFLNFPLHQLILSFQLIMLPWLLLFCSLSFIYHPLIHLSVVSVFFCHPAVRLLLWCLSVESVVSSSTHPGGARAPPGGWDRQRPAGPGPAQTPQRHDDNHCWAFCQHLDSSELIFR